MTLWFEGVTDVLPIYYVSIIDLRMNPFKEMVNDENKQASPNDPLKVLIEFITRSKTKSVFVSVIASAFEANHGNKSFGKMRNVIYCA